MTMTKKYKMKIKKTNKRILHFALPFCILIFAFYVFADKAEAAALYFNPNQKEATLGEVFPVEIRLDAENEDLNAVEIKVGVQDDKLRLKDWSDGGSIINYWAEKPVIDEAGNLSFQGVMLGGFKEKNGKILTLYYEALKPGQSSINIQTFSTVYLNDGKGTKANLNFNGAFVNISSEAAEVAPISIIDTTPPETLEAIISSSKDVYDGQYFIVFAAKDEGSGLDYIEIKEGDEPWVRAESPYLLKNQKLDKDILIKAVDKNGNARIETLKLKQYQLIKKGLYVVVLILIVLAVWQIFKKRKPE